MTLRKVIIQAIVTPLQIAGFTVIAFIVASLFLESPRRAIRAVKEMNADMHGTHYNRKLGEGGTTTPTETTRPLDSRHNRRQ